MDPPPPLVVHNQPTLDLSGNCLLPSETPNVTPTDLSWPLPIGKYEHTHASILKVKPMADPSGRSLFYTYSIRFQVLEIGLNPLEEQATDFALITPSALETEVAHMSVNLHLPGQVFLKANLSPCQPVELDYDQVSFLPCNVDPFVVFKSLCLLLFNPSKDMILQDFCFSQYLWLQEAHGKKLGTRKLLGSMATYVE